MTTLNVIISAALRSRSHDRVSSERTEERASSASGERVERRDLRASVGPEPHATLLFGTLVTLP